LRDISQNLQFAELMARMRNEDSEVTAGEREQICSYFGEILNTWVAADRQGASGLISNYTSDIYISDVNVMLNRYPIFEDCLDEVVTDYGITSDTSEFWKQLLDVQIERGF